MLHRGQLYCLRIQSVDNPCNENGDGEDDETNDPVGDYLCNNKVELANGCGINLINCSNFFSKTTFIDGKMPQIRVIMSTMNAGSMNIL